MILAGDQKDLNNNQEGGRSAAPPILIMEERSKYNVGKGKTDVAKRTCDGITFDSILEMKYYRDVLLPMVNSGEVIRYELQKRYELQPGFSREGKRVLPIFYVADFYIEFSDGSVAVIDTKGCPDRVAKMKKKLFWYKYPEIDYQWITYVKKYGGWISYEECQKLRKEDKRQRSKKNGAK